jgi:hypothetical protein
MTHFLG